MVQLGLRTAPLSCRRRRRRRLLLLVFMLPPPCPAPFNPLSLLFDRICAPPSAGDPRLPASAPYLLLTVAERPFLHHIPLVPDACTRPTDHDPFDRSPAGHRVYLTPLPPFPSNPLPPFPSNRRHALCWLRGGHDPRPNDPQTKTPSSLPPMRFPKLALAAAALLGHHVRAQVHTDCNPLEKDCPANPAWGTSHLFSFNATPSNDLWETTAGKVTFDADKGAGFTITKQGDSPTIRTKFYFFFGRTEILLKVAPGRGIVSSMMWLSDDLDEVDWEFLGSNTTFATTNYFGKGRQDWRNGGAHPMTGMQDDYHNYTTVWTKEQIDWFIDGNHVRTLVAKDANNTENYPQTPMRMSVGIWAGGDPSLPEGTRKWAGGDTDYASGPYTMYLKAARVTDFSSGKEYSYGDRSGSWKSINIAA